MKKHSNIIALLTIASVLAMGAASGVLRGDEPAPVHKPAVLFTGAYYTTPEFEFARWLVRDGFSVRGTADPALTTKPLTWEDVKQFNVIVLTGIDLSNGDKTLNALNKQTQETLHRFLEEGGGILYFPFWRQQDTLIPPQLAFTKTLGLTPIFEDVVVDPATAVRGTTYKVDFAHTTEIAKSPITEGVASLWYPSSTRVGGESQAVPLLADASWTTVVTGSKTSHSRTIALITSIMGKEGDPGKFQSSVPLVAYRQVGKGRIVYCGINAAWIHGSEAGTSLEGIVREKGLNGIPSDGYKLVLNSLRWLAEPSLPQANLGGATTDPVVLENPHLTKFATAFDWSTVNQGPFPSVGHAFPGMIGARTELSGGKGTVEDWVKEAKALGLSYIVFLEDFAQLPPDKFAKLKSECARLTDANFAAVPGIRIQDEVGNHYFYCGANVFYPPKYLLSKDGKVFVSYDPDVSPGDPRKVKGQINMAILIYDYQIGGFKFTAGNYLFHGGDSPFANFFGLFTSVGVITRQNGKVIEDALPEYLDIAQAGQGPLPLAVDLMDDPAELKQSPWRTVVEASPGDHLAGGPLDGGNPVAAYFGLWNFYPDNPTRIYVTSGPQIDYWSDKGPSDYAFNNKGDFVWQNLRWQVGGKVSSEAGLKEVAVYDGKKPFRRFLVHGEKQFAFTLDLTHDKQHNLILMATDVSGNRAVSGEIWNRNQRMEETNCTDRDNQLTYGYQTRSDGTRLEFGGNCPATPSKRIRTETADPVAGFYIDWLFGANAFDGGAAGYPSTAIPMSLLPVTGSPILSPKVGEAQRLFHSGDTHIGNIMCEYNFADGVPVYNVWNTLWKTEPARDFVLEQRNQLFQLDPNSPFIAYLVKLRVTMKRDLPNNGFAVASLNKNDCSDWVVRSSDGQLFNGGGQAAVKPEVTNEKRPFAPGGYAAMLGSSLGSQAMFSLSDGLEVSFQAPHPGNVNFNLTAAASPQKQGESKEVDLLIVGIPRLTPSTELIAKDPKATVARFASDFGLSTAQPAYTIKGQTGKILSQRYILQMDGSEANAFSGEIDGDLISSLPIAVSGLNDHWSAVLYDRNEKKARPIGVFENQAWATVLIHGKSDLFIGHPVTCDNRNVVLQVTQTGENGWRIEAHNPTDADATVNLTANRFFDPLKDKTISAKPVVIPAGQSVFIDL